MPELPKVKICGITRQEDAALALSLGADFLGVICFDRSPRCVAPEGVPELLEAIPSGRRVLVDVNPGTDQLDKYLEWGFDYFQLHCPYDLGLATLASWCGQVGGPERLWIAPKVPPEEPFPQAALEFADTVLYDTYSQDPLRFGGTGQTGDWERFESWRTLYQHKQWVLAGGLTPDNIGAALACATPDIVDFNSGVEQEPGRKDPEKLRRLFHRLPR